MSKVPHTNEVTFVGRHVHGGREYQGEYSGAVHRIDTDGQVKEWLSLSEAASRARLSVDEVKRLIREGELPAERRGRWRIHRGDLDEWRYRV